MTLLHGLGVPELFSPELTGEWEFKLAQMEHGQAEARRVHARDRRDDQAHRRQAQGLRERHDPRRLRDADGAVPEVRRRSARELQEVPVRNVRLRASGRSSAAGSSSRGSRHADRDRAIGPLDGFRSRIGRPFSAMLKLRRRRQRSEFDFGRRRRTRRRRGARLLRARRRSAPARSAARASSNTRTPTSARRRSARTRPATSAPAG